MVCKGEEKLTTIEKKNADVKFKVANVIISICVFLLVQENTFVAVLKREQEGNDEV